MILSEQTTEIKNTIPSDPQQSAEFDEALTTVYTKYIAGTPLTRRELVALINSATRLMKEVA